MKPPPNIRAKLTATGALPDDDVDLAETALVLASADRPGVPVKPYRRHLERLAEDVGAYAEGDGLQAGLDLRIEALRQVIARRYGYGGTDEAYDDADGANLMRVIDRRTGLPVLLGVLYIHAARALDWAITGIAFPGRFLVRMELDGARAILDPFAGFCAMTPRDMRALFKAVAGNHAELAPAHYGAVDARDVLMRIQNNVKARLLRADRVEEALECVETTLLFAPARAPLWREAGILNARLDNVQEAVAALEEYLRCGGGDAGRYRASILLQELRARLN